VRAPWIKHLHRSPLLPRHRRRGRHHRLPKTERLAGLIFRHKRLGSCVLNHLDPRPRCRFLARHRRPGRRLGACSSRAHQNRSYHRPRCTTLAQLNRPRSTIVLGRPMGLPDRMPFFWAALMPAATRSLISDRIDDIETGGLPSQDLKPLDANGYLSGRCRWSKGRYEELRGRYTTHRSLGPPR
jgi:hypothetical protein